MNKWIGMGRLTKDADIRKDGEKIYARFTLAVDRRAKENEADFINCVSFAKQAEFVEKYLKKGMKVVVIGRIQTGSYTNKEGQKVYTTDIITEEIYFAESKNKQEQPENDSNEEFMTIDPAKLDDMPF